jgi:hypothetical protein
MAYKDNNYQRSKNIYDVLAQVFEDIKHGTHAYAEGVYGGDGWNKPIQELEGIKMRLIGENHLQIVYNRYEVCSLYELQRDDISEKGPEFIKEVVKQLKKGFKDYTKKTLNIKEVKKDRSYEKAGVFMAPSGPLDSGLGHRGYGNRAHGRFLIRDSFIYEISANL